MSDYIFTSGDVDESISIMKEAARWLDDSGKTMWRTRELDRSVLQNPPEEFIVMYDPGGESIATLLLSFEDKLFFPDIRAGTSGFIHKLAIRRRYAGKGHIKRLIDYVASVCREKGITSLRLDCDANRKSLCDFYERSGFNLIEKKVMEFLHFGKIDVALYRLDF